MPTVSYLQHYAYPKLIRQSPAQRGFWQGVQFIPKLSPSADFLVCLNPPNTKISTYIPIENRILIIQEPPAEHTKWYSKTFHQFGTIITSFPPSGQISLTNRQPCLPWHVNKNYDELTTLSPGHKNRSISAIVSSEQALTGQKKRLDFLYWLKAQEMKFDWFGKGIRFIPSKYDGLYLYRYSFALENSIHEHYWTEKLADCFLSWTMPIYAGCPNILDYFPAESMVTIDLDDWNQSKLKIEEAIHTKKWEKNLDAIAYARKLILDQYQFFPVVANLIKNTRSKNHLNYKENLPSFHPKNNSFIWRFKQLVERWKDNF